MERNILVDKLKGYACFLVLFGHVIMGIRVAGVPIPSFFAGLEQFIWSFHVALFLFLSGVVYKETGEWKGKGTKGRFLLHKLCNLGIPYVVFSVIYILMNSIAGQVNTQSSVWDIFNIWKTPVAQYWFLYALLFLFCIWTCFSGLLNNWQTTILVVLLGYVLPLLGLDLGSFSVVFYSALAFGIGTFVDFPRLTKLPAFAKCAIVLVHIAVGVLLIVFGKIGAPWVKEGMLLFGIYASIAFISLLQNCKPIAGFLLFINKYSFQIYLLHTIFTAGVRILLLRLHIVQWWIHIAVGSVCGIAFSVLAAIIAKKITFLNFFFFPTKTYQSVKKRS